VTFGTKDVFAVGVPYFISVGACYLFGYWGAFNINVLEFIGLADLAKLAVYPIVASFAFVLAGTLIADILHATHLPPGGGRDTKIGVFGRKHWRGLLALLIIFASLIAQFGPEPNRWLIFAGLISLLSVPLSHVEKVIEIVPNPSVRAIALYLLILLPASSFAYGRLQAFFVQRGTPQQFVDVTRSKLPLVSDAKNPVAYVGLLGDIYVLREARTGEIVLVKQRDDLPLFLTTKIQ
jgi:hypothetical protein